MKKLLSVIFLFLSIAVFAAPVPTVSTKVAGMQKFDGFLPFYWDAQNGKIYLQIKDFNSEFIYIDSLPAGMGSNDIGLDRGKLGDTRIVKFIRSGPKVLLLQPNYTFRAISSDPSEKKAVEDSFAESVLWGFDVAAEEKGAVLIDATNFLLQDVFDVIGTLKDAKQGDYKLESSRSAFYLEGTKNFPKNTEIEAILTFTGESPGEWVKDVTPTPKVITVREHHSFVASPEPGYEPRKFDPRAGLYGLRFMDFASPVGDPIWKQWITRHRLDANHPIIYYIDRGAPEPIRSALLEGASWWSQAFEAAGFKNGFQVKIMPEGADMLDVRYNVVQWAHRFTRGWSYGNTVVDPRTGEIIKGHVTLGSQRIRQDYMIAEGLLAPYSGDKIPPDMLEMALARIRQLAAHEVGHTLGLTHNFAASINDRASVMDYPAPLVQIKSDGTLDLSNAYAKGIGEWDKVAIRFGYSQSTEDQRNQILLDAALRGLRFISDEDARPDGGAHPYAHLWDNGKDPVQELDHIMKIRAIALSHFSENNIRKGTPVANVEEVLVPIYLYHRYQIIAVSKLLGGLDYNYQVRGDHQAGPSPVSAEQQNKALDALLSVLQPEALALPDSIVRLIPPRAFGFPRWREVFKSRTGVTFDSIAPAESAANMTLYLILHPQRAARLVEQHARTPQLPGLAETIDRLFKATWKSTVQPGYRGEIQRTVDMISLYYLMNLTTNEEAPSEVRAIGYQKLDQLKQWLNGQKSTDANQSAVFEFAASEIERFQKDPKQVHLTPPVEPPPGAPIGD
jgi:hypothetical protein